MPFLCALLFSGFAFGQNCITTQTVSQGSNVYSQIFTTANPIAVNSDLNTIVYVHRQNTGAFGGSSGNLRYDYSTNGGATWTSNQGPINPVLTAPARYPQAAIYNPSGNTNPSNAYLVYQAPTVGTTWNGYVTGVRQLNNTNGTENYNQAAATNTYLPAGMMEGAPGEYWSVDPVWNGTVYSGLRVHKGTWANGDVTWTTNATLTPNFNTSVGDPMIVDYSMAFDPTGQYGWIGFITDLSSAPNIGSLYPAFYRTTDGGQSWSGPDAVDLNSFPCLTSQFAANTTVGSAFEMDLTVDVNGNVHALLEAAEVSTTAYSIVPEPFTYMVDITYDGGTYTAQPLGLRSCFRGTLGAANSVTMDSHPQCSRTDDGTKVFFFWTDSDSASSAGANDNPDLYGVSYDVVTKNLTDVFDYTTCSPSYDNSAWFPKMSAVGLQTASNRWIVPATFVDLGVANDPLQTTDFVYVGNIFFETADYVNPVCVNNASISSSGTLCSGGVTLTSSSGGAYLWSDGSTSQSITVNQAGTYYVTVSSNCCLANSDSIVVTGAAPATAAYSQSGSGFSYSFTDASTGSPSSWFWDFGDGATSTSQNASHTYTTPGTYTVCLTVTNSCGSDSTCSTLTVTCAAPTPAWTNTMGSLSVDFTDNTPVQGPATYAWTFGDGGTSSQQNPTHVYTTPGSYTVCLTVTDACGSNTTCLPTTVTCAAPAALWGTTSVGNGLVTFVDLSTNTPTSWSWTFGDGGTSTQQNPSHTYTSSGTYTVCMTATSACGSDTYCDTVSVVVVGLENVLVQGINVYPNPGHGPMGVKADFQYSGQLKLELLDATGRELMLLYDDWAEQSFGAQFELADLPGGLYYLRYAFEGESGVLKVLRW